ncbi:MAG: sigma-70 family RNA polymerase sigma factor [Myxococcota bacterium]
MTTDRPPRPQVDELYRRYGRAVHRRCLYFLRNEDDALDATHEVFLKIVENYDTYRGEASPLTWVVRIATNHCLNILRGRRAPWRERYRQSAGVEVELSQPDGRTLWKGDLVRAVLSRIPKDIQAAAVFYFVDEMNQEEAASAVGCSVPTLRKKLRRFVEIARRTVSRDDVDAIFGPAPI